MIKFSVTKQQNFWLTFSGLAMVASIIVMIISFNLIKAPLRPSLDFIGGTRLQLELACVAQQNCQEILTTAPIQEILNESNLGSSSVQIIDQYTLSIRTETLDVDSRTKLIGTLTEKIGEFDPKTTQIDTVGPTIGKELFRSGILALLASFAGIIIYLTFRFQLDYAIFAIVALVHDTLVTCGVFSVLGLVANVEVDSLFLVSLLTIIGFSVNDTVVIYDRIRENFEQNEKDEIKRTVNEIVDESVMQTLTRSINTNVTTLLPLVAIFIFGGATLKYFALALIVGFILGTYSTIFGASALLAWWRNRKEKVTVDTLRSEQN